MIEIEVDSTLILSATLDCKTCGACCAPVLSEPTYVDLVPDVDVRRLSPSFRRRHGLDESTGSLPTKYTEDSSTVCIALRGMIGRRVSCGIYERRPTLCVQFVVGSSACTAARREAGLTM